MQVADSWGFSGNHAKYRSGPLQFAKCLCPICWAFAVGMAYAYILLQARILPLWAACIQKTKANIWQTRMNYKSVQRRWLRQSRRQANSARKNKASSLAQSLPTSLQAT